MLPPIGKKKRYPALDLTVIHAVEPNPPAGRKRIEWKLLTDLEVHSCEEAVEKIKWYAMRWKIEVFHKILKSGCRAEDARLRTGRPTGKPRCRILHHELESTLVDDARAHCARNTANRGSHRTGNGNPRSNGQQRRQPAGDAWIAILLSHQTRSFGWLPCKNIRSASGKYGRLARPQPADRYSPRNRNRSDSQMWVIVSLTGRLPPYWSPCR